MSSSTCGGFIGSSLRRGNLAFSCLFVPARLWVFLVCLGFISPNLELHLRRLHDAEGIGVQVEQVAEELRVALCFAWRWEFLIMYFVCHAIE